MSTTTIIRVVTHAPQLQPGLVPEAAPVRIEHASPMTKAGRLLKALHNWDKAGLPLTPRLERKARLAACAICEFWDPEGNWGFGECRAPGCGCTKFKAWLLTETCPHPTGSRWP